MGNFFNKEKLAKDAEIAKNRYFWEFDKARRGLTGYGQAYRLKEEWTRLEHRLQEFKDIQYKQKELQCRI